MNTQVEIDDLAGEWQQWLERMPDFYTNLLESATIILILVVIRFLLLRFINRRIQDPVLFYKWRKNLAYSLIFIGFIVVGRIWFEGIASLATFLGLLGAGIVIALRDPLVDMAGWLFVILRKPFSVGDRIQIGDNRGDVIDIRPFKFSILEIGNWVHADQSTGRLIHIPNHHVFNMTIANYTSDFDFIWNEIEVLITFESNWRKARKILEEIAEKHLGDFVKEAEKTVQKTSRSYLIRYNYLTPIVYLTVAGDGVMLTLRHLTNPRKRRRMTMIIWEDVLDGFKKEDDVALAYKTYRIYQNPVEGKDGLKSR